MAMSTMMLDLLLMGENRVDRLLPGAVRFAKNLDPEARTTEEQVALYFFVLSHFVADACMPCHCDARKLAGYSNGLHMELEKHWSKTVGAEFDKKKLLPAGSSLTPARILKAARGVDDRFGLSFAPDQIPQLRDADVWKEMVNVCRGSFAIASIIAPPTDHPYEDESARAPFREVFGGQLRTRLDAITRVAMHDSVLNNAIIWRHIWEKASKST